ncbi:beta-galactosidase 10-like [Ziziphus jujuba]|uniref:Beta-galactosidase n=1 Tax=Ziziphus jujuba TaxID=326968 RepID=A0ABM3ITB1_ZIZJJ|nr:beta-galactosidase 10-like [Ziziphus jujuba]
MKISSGTTPFGGRVLVVVVAVSVLVWSSFCSAAFNVSYDKRSLIINGERKLLISASIHYPRSVPEMWPGLIKTAKEAGINTIESYVFWNGHEPYPGYYYFGERYDLVKFVKYVQDAGMYMILRIGPFVAAEWNFGGVPVWLHYVPGTVFRTNDTPYEFHMKRFTTLIVNMMKKEKLFASQGGPIVLSQVENEYGGYEPAYGQGGKRYAQWAASMAVNTSTGVPWIMCNQYDTPIDIITTCNSFYCDNFNNLFPVAQPKIWTENWPGWFKGFGGPEPHRPPEDIAFSVARFFQKNGSVQNYYMFHGGTNFDRTSGGPFMATSYDYQAPIDEYGIPRLPKWGHLKDLHETIRLCEPILLYGEPVNIQLGPNAEADVFTDDSGGCCAFLSNVDNKTDTTVTFRQLSYHLPAWSVSILPDCRTVIFNTAKITAQSSVVEMLPQNLQPSDKNSKALQWEVFVEKAGMWGVPDLIKFGFKDQLNTTKDTSDYLWYTTSIFVNEDERFLRNRIQPVLFVESKGHAGHIFVNGELQGSPVGSGFPAAYNFSKPIDLKAGRNDIALLSMTVGLQSAGNYYEWVGAGITGVSIQGFNNGTVNLSDYTWTYKIGLEGENLGIYRLDGLYNVNWFLPPEVPKNQPLTWYKAIMDAPPGDDPVGMDMLHMGKGRAWLNGQGIGRYWPIASSLYGCVKECDYRGTFFPNKCPMNCGEPTQRWYHIPRSWFKPTGNVLVIFEEKGGDPSKINFGVRKTTALCATVSEDYPSNIQNYLRKDASVSHKNSTTVRLKCPENALISGIKFASFGNPTGTCGAYYKGDCHDPSSISVVEKVCLNKNDCAVELTEKHFTMSLCPNITKKLSVEAVCN